MPSTSPLGIVILPSAYSDKYSPSYSHSLELVRVCSYLRSIRIVFATYLGSSSICPHCAYSTDSPIASTHKSMGYLGVYFLSDFTKIDLIVCLTVL